MRILHCTDIHGNAGWFAWLAENAGCYDLVCLTGDHLDLLDLNRIDSQLEMIEASLSRIEAVVALCSGNNDALSGQAVPDRLLHAGWLNTLRGQRRLIDGDTLDIEALKIRCLAWEAQIPVVATEEVWLSHAPPAGASVAVDQWGGDVGDERLAAKCRDGRGPLLILSGHQHHPRHWSCRVGRTLCLNPGHEPCAAVPNHIVVDTAANTAVLRGAGNNYSTVAIRGDSQ